MSDQSRADHRYTVGEIAEGLAAEAAQCADIRVEFAHEYTSLPSPQTHNVDVFKSFSIYTRKMPGPMECFDYRVYSSAEHDRGEQAPPMAGVHQAPPLPSLAAADVLSDDSLVCFDGHSTLNLRHKRKGYSPLAFIYPGRFSRAFWNQQYSPYDLVWTWLGPLPYYKVIQTPASHFVIEDQNAVLEGLNAVKLTGTYFDGRSKITLWVCPDHGFLPIRLEVVDTGYPELSFNKQLGDLIELKPGVWFPQLVVGVTVNEPAICQTQVFVMRSISIDPVPDEVFHPILPAGTNVTDTVRGISFEVSDQAPTTQETEHQLREFLDTASNQVQQTTETTRP